MPPWTATASSGASPPWAAPAAVSAPLPPPHRIRLQTIDSPGPLCLTPAFVLTDGGNMAGEPYYNFGNVLEWPEPDIFRSTIAHPRLVPYLDTLFGRGWRLASHGAQIFVQQKGSGGHGLHGSTARAFDPTHYYHHQNGEMRSGMIVCSFCLSDTRRGDGGFVRASRCLLRSPASHAAADIHHDTAALAGGDPRITQGDQACHLTLCDQA